MVNYYPFFFLKYTGTGEKRPGILPDGFQGDNKIQSDFMIERMIDG